MILVTQNQLPITHLQLYFTHRSDPSPSGRSVALNTLTQRQVIRGTRHRSRAQFMSAVGQLGTEVNLIQRRFAHSLSAVVLSRKWNDLMELIIEGLSEPRLCPDEFAQSKRAYQAELAARYDMDAPLAWLWLSRRVFYKHQWLRAGVSVTHEDIERTTLDEVKAVWSELFSTKRLFSCLTTDLTQTVVDASLGALSQALGAMSCPSKDRDQEECEGHTADGTQLQLCSIHPLAPLTQMTLTLVHKAERKQAQVFLALPSISPHHPDHLTLSLAICALGGTFSSPLMQEVRVKRGLSYGAHAGVRGEGEARYITFHATPEAPDVVETLTVMRNVLGRGAQGDLSDDEISFAKRYLINAHPFTVETPTMRAALISRARLQGLNPDEVLLIPQRLSEISADRVREVASKYLSTRLLEVLVLGDHNPQGALGALEDQLSASWDIAQVIRTDANAAPQSVWR